MFLKLSHAKNLSIVQGRQVIVFELEADSGWGRKAFNTINSINCLLVTDT
jgi:hypothetical protein